MKSIKKLKYKNNIIFFNNIIHMETLNFVIENRSKIDKLIKYIMKRYRLFSVYCYDDTDKKLIYSELQKIQTLKVINLDEDYKQFLFKETLDKINEIKNTSFFNDYFFPLVKKYVNEFVNYYVKNYKIIVISSNYDLIKFINIRSKNIISLSSSDEFFDTKNIDEKNNVIYDRIKFYELIHENRRKYKNINDAILIISSFIKIKIPQ